MRIFSKQAFKFPHPAGETEPHYVRDNAFSDVPDWVKETETFKLAHKHELITVIENKKDEQNAELGKSSKNGKEKEDDNKKDKEKEDEK